jgi:hypothetical protein
MGEYAVFNGNRVKIGTCEDMYYLRFDQRHEVHAEPGNVDPVKDAGELRFRFPFPDEDNTLPGEFENYRRSLPLRGFYSAPDQAHDSVQFKADAGYLISLPCPESSGYHDDGKGWRVLNGVPFGPRVARNGFAGPVHLTQQRYIDGKLYPVLRCGGCGARWREMVPARIEALAVAIRAEGERRGRDGNPDWYHAIADRVLEGAGIVQEEVSDVQR